MDHSALSRKRQQDAPVPAKPLIPGRDESRGPQEQRRPASSGRIRMAKNSSEIIRVPRKADGPERNGVESDANVRHFTVANVGAGGTLYLRPSRLPLSSFAKPPVTPPDTSDGETITTERRPERQSDLSGTWTPRIPAARSAAYDHGIPVPPLSLAKAYPKRRPRSASFSAASDRSRSRISDSHDFKILLNDKDPDRPKSSIDPSDGLLALHIPHYRLGTPYFSEHGAAYLHSSIYTTTTTSDDIRSSVYSRAEYDKLFPAPPGRIGRNSYASRSSSASKYLHPPKVVHSLRPSSRMQSTPTAKTPSPDIKPAIYNNVEGNTNNPSIARYNSQTGRIVAGTPAALIAQITSPLFLDYELLSDFFLTFRNFLSCRELLEYLLARMKWALALATNTGRIVRVRTFVALRHWILNYFADDFASNASLRQRFCNLVNRMVSELRSRPDRGGSDVNIIGELKKCWRRTCVMYWPTPDAPDTSPDEDITPGGAREGSFAADGHNAHLADQADVEPDSQTHHTDANLESNLRFTQSRQSVLQLFGPASGEMMTLRTASIPASPMSEHSLQVLSCSVPFLRHLRQGPGWSGKGAMARPVGSQSRPPLSGRPSKPLHQRKRTGSFSDTLRNERTPLPSSRPVSVDIQTLPTVTFIGGLVRGLLLQPCPGKLGMLRPISPTPGTMVAYVDGTPDETHLERSPHQLGVRRMMGGVRRALSSRKVNHPDSPSRSQRSTHSSGSRGSGLADLAVKEARPLASQHSSGPPRIDVLGDRIEQSYGEAVEKAKLKASERNSMLLQLSDLPNKSSEVPFERLPDSIEQPPPADDPLDKRPHASRWNSRVTASSQSIVIVNDTRPLEMPSMSRALPSVSYMSSEMAPHSGFGPVQGFFEGAAKFVSREAQVSGVVPKAPSKKRRRSSDTAPMHDSAAIPRIFPSDERSDQRDTDLNPPSSAARASSGIHPITARHQLRRRPGGDLKAADHVHDLISTFRPHTSSSFSTASRSRTKSTAPSHDLSGTHFSGQDFLSWRLPSDIVAKRPQESFTLLETYSSEPNMRPSFERQVSHLKKMPDRGNDGGIENTLLRLEGKTESRQVSPSAGLEGGPVMQPVVNQSRHLQEPTSTRNTTVSLAGTSSRDYAYLVSPRTETQGASIYHLSGSDWSSDYPKLQPTLLDGSANGDASNRATAPVLVRSSQASKFPAHVLKRPDMPTVSHKSKCKDMVGGSAIPASSPTSPTPQGSFLLDDNESLSEISTELAEQSGDDHFGVRSFYFDETMDEEPKPLPVQLPETPPSTVGAPGDDSPKLVPVPRLPPHITDRTIKAAASAPKLLSPNQDMQQARPLLRPPIELRRAVSNPMPPISAHLPFVLAFESEVIAEQLTIIEKDALDEVDWKDLIMMNWQHSPPYVRNWVDYLHDEQGTGIDLVVARFNLVVKWVVSEIVLTDAPSERARCITKFVHVAAHCLRFRNYASTYQITLALLSSDLARLHRTWALVAPAEKQTLDRLELLCQPLRNFYNLRMEMESTSPDAGCIPFIGLYTHDLMYNSQKPARITPSPPTTAQLINFERFQTAATIVKGLLRLIEASGAYLFHPHPEVLSRCLWLAALEDDEIAARSKALE